MPLINQKYFVDGDTLSSSDYNSNVDNWNAGSKVIDGSNIRDQGLDIVNFDNQSCTQLHQTFTSNGIQTFSLPAGSTSESKTIYERTIMDLDWKKHTINGPYKTQSVYVFRHDLTYETLLAGSGGSNKFLQVDIPTTAFAQFNFKWIYQSDQTTRIFMTRQVRFSGKQLGMFKGSGNIGFSTIFTSDMFNEVDQTGITIKLFVEFQQSGGSDMVLKKDAVHDSETVWNKNTIELDLRYHGSIMKYKRAM
jgi:hypothetical protein